MGLISRLRTRGKIPTKKGFKQGLVASVSAAVAVALADKLGIPEAARTEFIGFVTAGFTFAATALMNWLKHRDSEDANG